jgi:hypothetical protein
MDFLNSVSNKSLCGWFFFMYVLAVTSASLQMLYILFIYVPLYMKRGSSKLKFSAFVAILTAFVLLVVCVVQSLFLYSLCDRSLIHTGGGA